MLELKLRSEAAVTFAYWDAVERGEHKLALLFYNVLEDFDRALLTVEDLIDERDEWWCGK
jgi:hypothetical protein